MLLNPVFAHASTFSFIASLLGGTPLVSSAHVVQLNSQTMPVLSAAVNLDPHAAVGGGDITVIDGSALEPDQGPSGTVADITARPTSSQISVYTVRPGDTLSEIATMFGVSSNTIVWANDIQKGTIQPGQTLIILPISGIQHTVAKGETLESLATAYKSNAHDIASYNELADGAVLTEGQSVIIPNGEATAIVSGSGAAQSTPKVAVKVKIPVLSSHAKAIARIKKGGTEPFLGGSGPALDGYFSWPVDGGIITQGLHGWNGVDIGAPKGTGILASAAGTVLIAKGGGGWNGGYGNYVVIAHDNGTQTLYAHMSVVLTSAGATVGQGDLIGKVGMTGEATGNHLHFEIRGAVNPFASMEVGSSGQ